MSKAVLPARQTGKAASIPARLPSALLGDVRALIRSARERTARILDTGLAGLYWHIGNRIRKDILKGKRAGYGERIVPSLAAQLESEFGRGFGSRNLFRMIRFAEAFPDWEIVSALMSQLGWTHFLQLISLENPLQRDFYAQMCRVEQWTTRALGKKIASMLYERTALSRKPEKLARMELKRLRQEDILTPDLVFRDPYILDFLGLKDAYAERDLEAAILREIESFILELGNGFAFVARQKRIQVDGEDYYLDLLFYHRHLRRLVAIELKLGSFRPEFKGQMELYLRWLDRHERGKAEGKPIGLILCAGKRHETVELMGLEKSGIRVSSYWTEALPKKALEQKLHEAVRLARARQSQGKEHP